MVSKMNEEQKIEELLKLDNVKNAKLWKSEDGKKNRIYIDTENFDPRPNSRYDQRPYGGNGYSTLYICLDSKRMYASGRAGSVSGHRLFDTLKEIEKIASL